MLKKLRLRFVCITMTIVTVMLAVILGMIVEFTKDNLREQSVAMMQTVASSPIPPTKPGRLPNRGLFGNLPYFIIEKLPSGELIASGSDEYHDLSNKEFLAELMEAVGTPDEPIGTIKKYALRYNRIVTPLSERVIFTDISSELAAVSSLTRTCIFIGILAFAVFLVLTLLLVRWVTRPVEVAWKQQRQFVADASHELKTPLTVIMTNAELLFDNASADATRERSVYSILEMSRRMRGLVEELLSLARLDTGSAKAAFEAVNLSEITENAVLPFEAMFFERSLTLDTDIEKGIYVNGCASHLRQVIDILLDNAQKYSHTGGEVKVLLQRTARGAVLSVSNTGDAISKEELRDIFKRFYRADKSRGDDPHNDGHSYGLGLSIAESIVREHRGRISAESHGGVNKFTVYLPS